MKPWMEWNDTYRAVLVMRSVNEFSTGQIKLAYDKAKRFYDLGLDEDNAAEQALKDVKHASAEAVVQAELGMAKHQDETDKKMAAFRGSLGIGPDGELL